MRDMRKSKEYFQTFLDYQYSRIEKKMAKLKDSDNAKQQRILVSLTGFETDLLKAEFSAGASKENLKTLLIRALDICRVYKDITYGDVLDLLALSIMVGLSHDVKKFIEANHELVSHDRLLNCLAEYIGGNKCSWDLNLSLKAEFAGLNDVFGAEDKETAMKTYLKEWYINHAKYAWYDSHLKDTDTYCGYWSFESAAVAKILGLKEEMLVELVYYPVI